MCGITGLYSFEEEAESYLPHLNEASETLSKRGPDAFGLFKDSKVLLAHRRLSIIDTDVSANQPFSDESGRYAIVYNGEFYNYKEHREALIQKGVNFRTNSDTEVLLKLYIEDGVKCLQKINGFFAFAIYDKADDILFMARDRFGIKPLLYTQDDQKLIFASELKALLKFPIPKTINKNALHLYFQLNYIPGDLSIIENVKKLNPGEFLVINKGTTTTSIYYDLQPGHLSPDYSENKKKLKDLLEESVLKRLVSDVPLGTFLSGGIDSSIISTIAAKHIKNLSTFSIGYKDEPFFDETDYAHLVAKKNKTNHHTFYLSNDDFGENIEDILDYFDEPFADSSAIAVYILSKKTKKEVSVILSGDGADEIFSGYNKHLAEYKITHPGFKEKLVKKIGWISTFLPQSRNSNLGNLARQVNRFYEGSRLSAPDRYWKWASILSQNETCELIKTEANLKEISGIKELSLKNLEDYKSINDFLRTDVDLVLTGDMLKKVDSMSMANSLEVRTPFLDHHLVEFAFTVPEDQKIDGKMKKKILQETYQNELPPELFNRPKKGFEVPLLKWFRNELNELLEELTDEQFIREQNIFNYSTILLLKRKLNSKNPGDTTATIWALIVFQSWWKKNINIIE